MDRPRTAVIIGAGPAGLTAAYELLKSTDIKPVIYETSDCLGGIARTVDYKGNKIDIGGHRFFSKSDRVVNWWLNIMPLQKHPAGSAQADLANAPDPERTDRVMLIRKRTSRIFYQRKFFDYPLTLNFGTIRNLGLLSLMKIIAGYAKVRLLPIRDEKTLEDFFINRFGRELYNTFFKDYTQKVWGRPCREISAEWGAQRVKGLSITKVIAHSLRALLPRDSSISHKETETSLIEYFMYPKFGPGQLWQLVADDIKSHGGEIYLSHTVTNVKSDNKKITSVTVKNELTRETITCSADYVLSSMPVKSLADAMGNIVPGSVKQIASALPYRDFITAGLLLKKLKIKNNTKTVGDLIPDQWIYIQEKDVKVGRLQIFNNWSPYMVKDPGTVWLGLEYFCGVGDELWNLSDERFTALAVEEMAKLGFIEKEDLLDSVIIRLPNVYPCYFGSYERFDIVRNFFDCFEKLFLIGRCGMHRYNNQDHSMLTAMTAVENIMNNTSSKDNIWAVNTEQQYHEQHEKKAK